MILDAELCGSIQQYQQNVHLYFLLPFGIQRGMIKIDFYWQLPAVRANANIPNKLLF